MHISTHAAAVPHGAVGATAGAAQAQQNPRLVSAAHEFEAQLMKEMMKPLTKGSAPGDSGDEDDEDAGSNGALGEFASEALARALSQDGGFGIADRIIHQLAHRGAAGAGSPNSKLESGPANGKVRRKASASTP